MLLYLFSGSHGNHLGRLFGGHKRFYDGQWVMTGRYFKGWLIDENVDWDFSATCHGKGDIDGLGSTCKRRVHVKTLAHTNDLQNSIYFAKWAVGVCPGITIFHCSKTDAKEIKSSAWQWDTGTLTIGQNIPFHERLTNLGSSITMQSGSKP